MASENVPETNVVLKETTNETSIIDENSPLKSPQKAAKRHAEVENTENEDEIAEAKKPKFCEELYDLTNETPEFIAPVLWSADVGVDGQALHVDDDHCVVGLQDGRVLQFDHEGVLEKTYELPEQVGKLMKDRNVLYAWCHAENCLSQWKGALYEFSSGSSRLVYNVVNFGNWVIFADMVDGLLALGDDKGSVAVLGCGGQIIWEHKSTDETLFFLYVDENAVYAGQKKQIIAYSTQTGRKLWTHKITGRHSSVQHGAQDRNYLYAEVSNKVLQLEKSNGTLVSEFSPNRHRASGVCVGNNFLITGSCPTVLFSLDTKKEVYRMNYAGRLADSGMALHSSGKMFLIWDKIYCINLSQMSIDRAVEGKSTRTKEVKIPEKGATPESDPSYTEKADPLMVYNAKVICGEREGEANLFGEGTYDGDWGVCFPQSMWVPEKCFRVEFLLPSQYGKFYRVLGKVEMITGSYTTKLDDYIYKSSTSLDKLVTSPKKTPEKLTNSPKRTPDMATSRKRTPKTTNRATPNGSTTGVTPNGATPNGATANGEKSE